jgi:hypothetical protein
VIAGTASDALCMCKWARTTFGSGAVAVPPPFRKALRYELSLGAFPLLPDHFAQLTGALVVLGVALALLVLTATLATQGTSHTETQSRDYVREEAQSRPGRDSSRGDCEAADAPLPGSPSPRQST